MKKLICLILSSVSFLAVNAQIATTYNFEDATENLRRTTPYTPAIKRMFVDSVTSSLPILAPPAGSIWVNRESPFKNYTIEELVKKVFVEGGDCLVSNVTFKGWGWNQNTQTWTPNAERSLAYFSHGTLNGLGMEEGILLATGDVLEAEGPNSATNGMEGGFSGTDSNLSALIPGYSINTVSVLEFDLIPFTNSLHFDYIFASEEYPEFSCSNYNDVFGFFISGPGITGTRNIALIPNTNMPVSIANIHPYTSSYCLAQNAQYYVDGTGNLYTEFDGHTTMLTTAATTVIPGSTYHLKLAIANVGDYKLGSGVFLRAGSLDLGLALVNHGNDFQGMDNVFEGCGNNQFIINLSPLANGISLILQYSGTAVNDIVSPDGSPLPATVTIPAGTSEFSIPYKVNSPVTANGGTFTITITTNSILCQNQEIINKTIYVYDKITNPQFNITTTCDNNSGTLGVVLTEGSPNVKFSIDDENIWHNVSNYSVAIPVGAHTIILKDSGSCSVDTFNINVPYKSSSDTTIYDTIYVHQSYHLNGFNVPEQDNVGVFYFPLTLQNVYGCDSTVYLILTVLDIIIVEFFPLEEICADNANFNIGFHLITGVINNASVIFNDKAHAAGFVDIINQNNISNRNITVPLPENVRPNNYSANVIFANNNVRTELPLDFTVLYPVSIIKQKWNDVLALFNENYNGGYIWSNYEWYKNDIQIPNENGSFLYVGANGGTLDFTAEYRVRITRVNDGVTLFTCPLVPEYNSNAYQTLHPILATPGQLITIVLEGGKIMTLWTVLGTQIAEYPLINGTNTINAPAVSGTYILSIKKQNGEQQNQRIVVR